MNILIWLLTAVHLVIAVVMIIVVLMQKSQDQGVGAAFGAGMTDNVFGADTTNALQRMTIWCACGLLATTLILAVLHAKRSRMAETKLPKMIQRAPAPVPAKTPISSMPLTTTPTAPAAPETPATPAAPAAPAVPATPAPAK